MFLPLAQEAPVTDPGFDLVALVESLLPFVPEEYRGWAALVLFVLGIGGYSYVSATGSKDDDGFFMKYFGGFRRLGALIPKKKVTPPTL